MRLLSTGIDSRQTTNLLTYLFTDKCLAHWLPYLLFFIVIQVRDFGGWASRGSMTLKFELGQDFLTMHLLALDSK